jgi:hypothetical protein
MITRNRAWRITSKLLLASAVCHLLAIAAPVDSIELITNGNFETGTTLVGWTVESQVGGEGSWFRDIPGTPTPVSGKQTSSAGGLAHGTGYAVTDQPGPGGSHSLLQSFTILPGAASIVLSFDMFINNWDNGPYGTSQDFTIIPNQHARVDILTGRAGAFDTGAGVLRNVFLGGIPVISPSSFTRFSFDVTNVFPSAGTYQIRFSEVDTEANNNLGVDNVSVLETVPEPGTFILLLSGIMTAALYLRSRKR